MELALAVVSLVLVLVIVGRGTPARRWPMIVAVTLAVIVLVVLLERGGYWPAGWRTR